MTLHTQKLGSLTAHTQKLSRVTWEQGSVSPTTTHSANREARGCFHLIIISLEFHLIIFPDYPLPPLGPTTTSSSAKVITTTPLPVLRSLPPANIVNDAASGERKSAGTNICGRDCEERRHNESGILSCFQNTLSVGDELYGTLVFWR